MCIEFCNVTAILEQKLFIRIVYSTILSSLHKLRTATYPFDDGDVADVKQRIANADMSKCKQSVFLVDQVEGYIPMTGTKLNTVSFAMNK